MKVMFDSDGFLWPDDTRPDDMAFHRDPISFEKEHHSPNELFEQYYLGLRSSMFICEDSIEDECEAKEVLKEYREDCVQFAFRYTSYHLQFENPLPPDFMWIVREAIDGELKEKYPEVSNVKLRLSMKPRLSARTVDKSIIIFPALTRAVLMHCNLSIINTVYRTVDKNGEIVAEFDQKQIARTVFPYLLFCHDNFSVLNLPIIGAHSLDTLLTASRFTNLQLIFIIAHEYAHILLRHFDDSKVTLGVENIENEADTFALRVVLAYGKKSESYSEQDILAAIRWLFKYQLIEECMGDLIRGEPIGFSSSRFEDRRSEFQTELLINHGMSGSTLFESIGFYIIVAMQDILWKNGSKLINDIIETFHKSETTGEIEPWWERII